MKNQLRCVKVLIADDDDLWARTIADCLEDSFDNVEIELESFGGLTLQHARQFKPDYLVLDNFFADSDFLSGDEVLKRLVATQELQKTFVLHVDSSRKRSAEQPTNLSPKVTSVSVDRLNVVHYLSDELNRCCNAV